MPAKQAQPNANAAPRGARASANVPRTEPPEPPQPVIAAAAALAVAAAAAEARVPDNPNNDEEVDVAGSQLSRREAIQASGQFPMLNSESTILAR